MTDWLDQVTNQNKASDMSSIIYGMLLVNNVNNVSKLSSVQ